MAEPAAGGGPWGGRAPDRDRRDADVIVVGAGPVGLLLAGELRLGGARVVVLERLGAPTGESRATHLNARTMEVLDQRGLLGRLGPVECDRTSHFGGVPVDLGHLPSRHAGLWRVRQPLVESVLEEWARELGAEVRRGHELRDMTVTRSAVLAEVDGPSGPLRLRADYLVGCDGEESTVRRLAGFELAGSAADRLLYRADLAGVDLGERRLRRYPQGLATAARRDDGTTRIMVHEFGRPPARVGRRPSFDEVAAVWRRVTGEDVAGGRPVWLDSFDDASRQVTRYRRGRVLLAGDAAHVQMPVGGQAINLGLQDAANLGWKLAAQVRGWASPGLLDSYHDERHPVGARTLRDVRAQSLLLFGGPEVDAMRGVLTELLGTPDARRHLAAAISGLDVRYPIGRQPHPLVGHRISHCVLLTAGGWSSTTALLQPARGVLVCVAAGRRQADRLRDAAAGWAGRVRVLTARTDRSSTLHEERAVLLRPDGHVAWSAAGGGRLLVALHRWFGAPGTGPLPVD
ncbi:FAD-dependent monooxygenase [Micromonospora sp. NBC_01655]|uniref:FAD-dependent monooxygenase n=1 Tax=Micromonospora sp. NBC_01655 TaxID=2975983 RepID=UPI00224FAF1C|nr:FAD-dependent monooxygenase [Micromonospora sp. NBC_01655]MCX4469494.1 FAD-dependent monooxygenase [Micromonospora sp. NBC_01655]